MLATHFADDDPMLSAFEAHPIIELKQRDKSKIESILSHSDQLLVGLNSGSLRIYRINGPSTPHHDADNTQPKRERSSELLREYEKFSKYKLDQLAIFREANILICLSNAVVSLYDLGTYELQEQLTRTKGALTFAVTSNIVKDEQIGVPSLVSRLAVAVKRRLLLWSWQDGELGEDVVEIPLASTIKSLTWATGTTIIAGLNANYELVDVELQKTKTIVGPGSIGGAPGQDTSRLGGTMSYIGMGSVVPEPLATGLGEKDMLLAKDINTYFIDRAGEPIGRRQVPWKSTPQAVGYSYPFLLSLQEPTKGVLEVRNPETLTLLQSIELPGALRLQVPNPNISLAHQGKGFLVASERIVWQMQGLKYDAQIDALVDTEQYDEVISLLGMIEDTLIQDHEGRLREVKMLKAQRLFDQKKFRESLDLFSEVSAPPERVIRLYPAMFAGDLAPPEELTKALSTPGSPVKKQHKKTESTASVASKTDVDAGSIRSTHTTSKDPGHGLTDIDLKPAVRELQAFLPDCRRRLQRFFNPDQSVKSLEEVQALSQTDDVRHVLEHLLGLPTLEEVDVAEKISETARLVDTTLFRVYMFASPSLAGHLFRLPNFCDPDVVRSKLEENHRYSDLIDFLYGKRLHRQALERLQQFGQAKDDDAIDTQLQGPQRTISYLQALPPELIDLLLEFAKWPIQTRPDLAMQTFITDTENAELLPREKVLAFLESQDKTLAQQYLEHVIEEWNDLTPDLHQKLLSLYLDRLQAHSSDHNEVLSRFNTFLKQSSQYSAAKILNALPRNDPTFYEALAILFSKMGNFKQALEVYIFKLGDTAKAEEYCNRLHVEAMNNQSRSLSRRRSTNDPNDEQPSVYHILFNLYLNPPKGESKRWGPAIELMTKHGARLPASSTLELIPPELLVKELEFYFRGRMRNATTITNESRIVAALRKADAVRVEARLKLGDGFQGARSRKVRVDEERVCPVCHKRLGGSVISVFPDNSVVHLGCANRRQSELSAH